MAYTPRTTAPAADDPNFIMAGTNRQGKRFGGRNPACEGNYTKSFHVPGSVLPNCVGYVKGRWLELYGPNKLGVGNAWTIYGHKDGYERSQEPMQGAVICFSKAGGYGHVAIVEDVLPNGDIIISQSGYDFPKPVRTQKLTKKAGYTDLYWDKKSYRLQGFILPPEEYRTMTTAEKERIEALEKRVDALDRGDKFIKAYQELPEWAKPMMRAILDEQIINGGTSYEQDPDDINMYMSDIKVLIAVRNMVNGGE